MLVAERIDRAIDASVEARHEIRRTALAVAEVKDVE
jgi:hypothetical protein